MLNTIIIEDERSASQNLVNALMNIDADIHVAAQLFSVKESIEYFLRGPEADLIFCDVRLADGLSFEIQTGHSGGGQRSKWKAQLRYAGRWAWCCFSWAGRTRSKRSSPFSITSSLTRTLLISLLRGWHARPWRG